MALTHIKFNEPPEAAADSEDEDEVACGLEWLDDYLKTGVDRGKRLQRVCRRLQSLHAKITHWGTSDAKRSKISREMFELMEERVELVADVKGAYLSVVSAYRRYDGAEDVFNQLIENMALAMAIDRETRIPY